MASEILGGEVGLRSDAEIGSSGHVTLLGRSSARDGDAPVGKRVGLVQSGNAIKGYSSQVGRRNVECIRQAHQRVDGPLALLVWVELIAGHGTVEMKRPCTAILARGDEALDAAFAAQIDSAFAVNVGAVGHDHECHGEKVRGGMARDGAATLGRVGVGGVDRGWGVWLCSPQAGGADFRSRASQMALSPGAPAGPSARCGEGAAPSRGA